MILGWHLAIIMICLLSSVLLIPWRFLRLQLERCLYRFGHGCARRAPPLWRSAWGAIAMLEYRLSLGLTVWLLMALWLWLAPVGVKALGLVALACLGAWLIWPLWRACRAAGQRRATIIAALPAQLDLLAMLLIAGQPLLSSLQQSSAAGMDNPLREELRLLLTQVRAGLAVDEAFQRLAQRYPCRELRLFCSALQHARESGSGLAQMLYEQAEQRRQELFLAAEKRAMEAPVKLMFPLLMFVFPGTVLVLLVTLVAKMMWQL